jgi:hypothetical protein
MKWLNWITAEFYGIIIGLVLVFLVLIIIFISIFGFRASIKTIIILISGIVFLLVVGGGLAYIIEKSNKQ